jgi:hypothetical protein
VSRGEEIARVAAQLDGLLDELHASVDALNRILTRPAPGGGADDERLVPQ